MNMQSKATEAVCNHVLLFGVVVVQAVELEMSGVRGSGLRFAID
jgi:hypothetical protein